jgi:uncharacterized protein
MADRAERQGRIMPIDPHEQLPPDFGMDLADLNSRPRRYTLCTTLQCNLDCSYCYVRKTNSVMSLDMARRSLDFIFRHAPHQSKIEIGFFGGEPLLEFPLLKDITAMIEDHPAYDPDLVRLTITTNGTIFSDAIAAFLNEHSFKVCFSCDGPPQIQNLFRHLPNGKETAVTVEQTLRMAQQALPLVLVNAVYTPLTFRQLPETLEYFSDLGLRRIFLNPDYSAAWTQSDVEMLPQVYRAIADRYIAWYLQHEPHFVSLIDTKVAVIVRGGYHPLERCQMGTGELTITPDGNLYPCERLISNPGNQDHCIGNVESGVDIARMVGRCAPGEKLNPECSECTLKELCMNWCGCSNAFMTGYYNRVGPFLCASEHALIQTALDVFITLENRLGPVFIHHLAGRPQWNSLSMKEGGANTCNPTSA